VAFHTIQALLMVEAVIEFYNLFFDRITQIEHILVAVQASLGGQFVIGKIFRRDELIPGMS
jgi:hypothetical protein